jgi:hypothetical protein
VVLTVVNLLGGGELLPVAHTWNFHPVMAHIQPSQTTTDDRPTPHSTGPIQRQLYRRRAVFFLLSLLVAVYHVYLYTELETPQPQNPIKGKGAGYLRFGFGRVI